MADKICCHLAYVHVCLSNSIFLGLQYYPWGVNALPEDRKLTQRITGNYSGPAGDLTPVPDFYHIFAVEHNKPMAIAETGAMYNTQSPAVVDAYHMKAKWMEQVRNCRMLLKLWLLSQTVVAMTVAT